MASNIKVNLGPMDWTDEHDKSLMKEVRVQNPFQAKKKTTARAKMWQSIAEALSGLKDPPFKEFLTKRSVQDRYSLVSEKYRMRMRKEAMASGISPPHTELDQLIEECIELEKLGDDLRQKDGEVSSKSDKEKANALEMRRIAMETLGQSKKRKRGEEEDKRDNEQKRRRNSGRDTLEYLRERNAEEMKIREQELKVKENQLEMEKQRHEAMMQLIHQQQQQQQLQQQHQQQQQQQQQQQFQALMQQQSQVMMTLLQQLKEQRN